MSFRYFLLHIARDNEVRTEILSQELALNCQMWTQLKCGLV
uniref:Uncharacterized protein n=1 Tax=Anguilla anguilla TaxID=7936 RepID=A0A0E9QII8_ANGAN